MISQVYNKKILIYFICSICFTNFLLGIIFSKEIEVPDIDFSKKPTSENNDNKIILGNLFHLSKFDLDVSFSSIKDEIEITLIEPRFDTLNKTNLFEISLKNKNSFKKVTENEKIYLLTKKDGAFEFSDQITPFFIYFNLIDTRNIKMTIEVKLDEMNLFEKNENVSQIFVLPILDRMPSKEHISDISLKALFDAKWFGIDQFLKIVNNDERQRIEILGNTVLIQENDLLIFKAGRWIKLTSEDTKNFPIAKIKIIDSKTLRIDAWDINSENKVSCQISLDSKDIVGSKTDLITSLKKRTHLHLSCLLDKQRIILKEKDIFIKKDGRWKLIRKGINFDDLKFDDLFYFQKIESKNDTSNLIGYFFNSTRTSFQKVEIPILSNQKHIKRRII